MNTLQTKKNLKNNLKKIFLMLNHNYKKKLIKRQVILKLKKEIQVIKIINQFNQVYIYRDKTRKFTRQCKRRSKKIS